MISPKSVETAKNRKIVKLNQRRGYIMERANRNIKKVVLRKNVFKYGIYLTDTHLLIFFVQQHFAMRMTTFYVLSMLLMLSLNPGVKARCYTNGCNAWDIVPYKHYFRHACNKHDVCYLCVRTRLIFQEKASFVFWWRNFDMTQLQWTLAFGSIYN